jgi:cell division protein FtsI (penicillin-binding protein 3)
LEQSLKLVFFENNDSISIMQPEVKFGNMLAADYVLSHLGYETINGWNGKFSNGKPIWGNAKATDKSVMTLKKEPIYSSKLMPNVIGMGARDAVYMIESRGVKVHLSGRGKVTSQSLSAGHKIKKGDVCMLKLE